MTAADYLMLISMVCIWALMAINVFLSVGGFLYYHQCSKTDGHMPIDEYPFVSIMVPAHNESVVIRRTVRALLNFDYPHDRYEIIVINDNSTDDTANVLKQIQAANPGRNLIVVNTDNVVGGKGKSNALNIGYSVAKGSVFAIYDADNTPEPQALRILVENLMSDSSLGAVIGKFRTRNRNASLLTRFVNIETLAHQCMNQAGRWFYFGLCTIPGTNFVMHRHIIEEIGGWDPDALSEDTEISFRIYRMGYKIKLVPQAVTWEQEPFRLGIWFKQRTRWAMGNLYVLINNFKDTPYNCAQTIHVIPVDQNFEKERNSSALFAREINLVTQPSFDCEQGINSQVQTACSNADAIFPVLGIVSCRNERFSLSRKTHVPLWNEPRISHVRLP